MSHNADTDLMEAVLRQLDGKIDFKILAHDLGLSNPGSASNRWRRFKTKLMSRASTSPTSGKPMNGITSSSPVTLKGSSAEKAGKVSKKRKVRDSDAEEDEDESSLGIKKEDVGIDSNAGLLEMPTRQMPARKARVTVFKDESSEDEDFEEERFEDSGHGSGYGGTEDTRDMS